MNLSPSAFGEIGKPWEFHEPPPYPYTADLLLAWYVKELCALIESGGGRDFSQQYNVGYLQGLQKAKALLNPHTCSNWGAVIGPPYVNDPDKAA